ncbi:MAG: methyltransferase domain-containing protein [Amaricoccus sp.]
MNLALRPEPRGEAATATSYEPYFATGAYDRRYPQPNPTVLRLIRRLLPPGGHVIDYGCGSGRYLLPLAGHAGVAAGFDICPAALARLREVAPAGLAVLGPEADTVPAHVARHGPADLVLCLFGVLSHVEGRDARQRLLRRLRALLRPGTGRLVLSVPNRRRRFRALQRRSAGDEIRYVRRFAEGAVELPYKLYEPPTLAAELAAAGFDVERMAAESLLPETAVARSPLLRTLDRLAAPLLPASRGYGLLAVARPETG